MKRTLYTSHPADFDYEAIKADYIEFSLDGNEDMYSESDMIAWHYEEINMDGEIVEYDMKEISKTAGKVFVFGTVGLWNGRMIVGEIVDSLDRRIARAMEDYNRITLDRDLAIEAVHHDGTNHYTIRQLKPDLSEIQRENFENKLDEGLISKRDITHYTRSLRPLIARYYGF